MNYTNEEKDRKRNPYYNDDNDIAEDDYSEESNPDSVYKENEMSNDWKTRNNFDIIFTELFIANNSKKTMCIFIDYTRMYKVD